ncbi:MAG: lysophospholipase L1-like esterase [Planctomycetota bacterium]|jgi:lysophospholipase L1-like esterase
MVGFGWSAPQFEPPVPLTACGGSENLASLRCGGGRPGSALPHDLRRTMNTLESSRRRANRRWLARLLAVAGSLLLCDVMLWLLVGLPSPYAPANERRDLEVKQHLQGAPSNRYIPSYHVPGTIDITTEDSILPGVAAHGTFTINRFGFRSDRLTEIAKPVGTTRVFCVGGSTTECIYLDDANAWPELLQQQLGSAAGLDVINAGHSGDATRDHLALLSQRIVPFDPDVVLLMIGINDMFHQMAPDYSLLREDLRSMPGQGGNQSIGLFGELKLLACRVSQIARGTLLFAQAMTSRSAAGNIAVDAHGGWIDRERIKWRALPWTATTPVAQPSVEFAQNLRSMVGVCQANGALPVLVTQPALWGCEDSRCEQLFWRRPPGDARVQHTELWRVLEQWNNITRAVATELRVPVIDLARSMPKSVDLFYDDDHCNDAGAQHIAGLLADGLRAAPPVATRLQLPK